MDAAGRTHLSPPPPGLLTVDYKRGKRDGRCLVTRTILHRQAL